jgi:hypothetical protein
VDIVSVACAADEPGITLAGLKEQVTPAGSGVEHVNEMPVLNAPAAGETEIANVVAVPANIDAAPGVAIGALKSSPVPDRLTVTGLAFDPLCLMVSVPMLGPVCPGLNVTFTLHTPLGDKLTGRVPQLVSENPFPATLIDERVSGPAPVFVMTTLDVPLTVTGSPPNPTFRVLTLAVPGSGGAVGPVMSADHAPRPYVTTFRSLRVGFIVF